METRCKAGARGTLTVILKLSWRSISKCKGYMGMFSHVYDVYSISCCICISMWRCALLGTVSSAKGMRTMGRRQRSGRRSG